MRFAFETVFCFLEKQSDGMVESKPDIIRALQAHGYFVRRLFVGSPARTYSSCASSPKNSDFADWVVR